MEKFNTSAEYYNLAGKYTLSKRDFFRYLERESAFYIKLHEQALTKGSYGIKRPLDSKKNTFDMDWFNLV